MRRGQIFATDLVVSLLVIVAFVGLVVAGFDAFLQDSSATVDSVKMHQIAADAAAIKHYEQLETGSPSADYGGLKTSADRLNYDIDPITEKFYQACVNVSRGSKDRQAYAEVCR